MSGLMITPKGIARLSIIVPEVFAHAGVPFNPNTIEVLKLRDSQPNKLHSLADLNAALAAYCNNFRDVMGSEFRVVIIEEDETPPSGKVYVIRMKRDAEDHLDMYVTHDDETGAKQFYSIMGV